MLSAPMGKASWGQHFINQGSSYSVGCWGTRRRYGDKPSLAKVPAGGPGTADGPTIDVFWVSDTGGCLLLIAYMHSQWNKWSKPCRLVRFSVEILLMFGLATVSLKLLCPHHCVFVFFFLLLGVFLLNFSHRLCLFGLQRIFVHANAADSISTTAKVMSMVRKFRIAVSEVVWNFKRLKNCKDGSDLDNFRTRKQ